MLHHACMDDCFYILKRTTLSHTENMTGLWWQRKWSAISTSPPSHSLRFQAIHKRFHWYVLPTQFCEQVRQWHLRPPILITRSNGRHYACAYGRFISTGDDVEAMDSSKRDCFCNSFRTSAQDIDEGLSSCRATTIDDHWTEWVKFY